MKMHALRANLLLISGLEKKGECILNLIQISAIITAETEDMQYELRVVLPAGDLVLFKGEEPKVRDLAFTLRDHWENALIDQQLRQHSP